MQGANNVKIASMSSMKPLGLYVTKATFCSFFFPPLTPPSLVTQLSFLPSLWNMFLVLTFSIATRVWPVWRSPMT